MAKNRRCRRLANPSTATPTQSQCLYWIKVSLLSVVLSVLYLFYNDSPLLKEFNRLSLIVYQNYIFGKSDYCNSDFNSQQIMSALRKNIYAQNEALTAIDAALNTNINISSIALIGTQGVGKSLTIQTIQSAFPWPYNMQSLAWAHTDSQFNNLDRLRGAFEYLSVYGRNAVFIDNIYPADSKIIVEFDADLRKYCLEHKLKVFAFYVFNIGRQDLSKSDKDKQHGIDSSIDYNNIQIPSAVKSIYFRTFDETDLRECIRREAAKLDLVLTEDQIVEVTVNVDIESTGFKTVKSKVSRNAHLTY